ncbi:MAG: VacJ family lipoprotein [Halioglobus sp.]
MNCKTLFALPGFTNPKIQASMRRASGRHPVLIAVVAFSMAVLLFLPMSSQASQDPLMEVNRSVHGFNRAVDSAVLKPIAQTYTKVTPSFVQRRLQSFFSNIDDVRVTINDLLQLKFSRAASDAGRLVVNTTVGLGGLFDVAEPALGLEKHYEDFGQTLGFWSVNSGPYIELPFLGPSTLRDSAGLIVDVFLNPTQLLQTGQATTLAASESVHDRAALLEVEGLISGDDYVFIREVYLQRRAFLVNDGRVEDSFGDFDSDFDSYLGEDGFADAEFETDPALR